MSDGCQDTAAELGKTIRRLIESRGAQPCCIVTALVDELSKVLCQISTSEADAIRRAVHAYGVFRRGVIRRIEASSSAAAFKANRESMKAEQERKAAAKLERQLSEFGIDPAPIFADRAPSGD